MVLLLPRDDMRKRGLYCRPVSVRPSVCLSVCLSVCPSVTYCIHTAEDIVKLLSARWSHHSSFLNPALLPNSKGNPFSEHAKYKGVGKFCDFRQKSPSISETVRDRPMVAMER